MTFDPGWFYVVGSLMFILGTALNMWGGPPSCP